MHKGFRVSVVDACQMSAKAATLGYVGCRGSRRDPTTPPKKPMIERQLVLTNARRLSRNPSVFVFVCVCGCPKKKFRKSSATIFWKMPRLWKEEETGALDEKKAKNERRRLNKDTAKSETGEQYEEKEDPAPRVERRLTRDINFSLKLAPRFTERKRPKTASSRKRHGRGVRNAMGKERGGGEGGKGRKSGERGARRQNRTAGGDEEVKKKAGEKCRGETRCASPWQSTVDGGSSPW
ncbi:hypothetical protein EAG_09925 [Camponotus floridanus]|uniref:Uncharacterized protein n=1 Tax=Camponotus floridanus TaxID=104421 RepID=E2A6F0_CAMFO|nr:hypothetical protein EAG_09925 [Camponotus floridanus]